MLLESRQGGKAERIIGDVANDLPDGPWPSLSAEDRARFAARWEAKNRVTGDLLQRRLTLFEAAALFRCVSQRWPLPSERSSGLTGEDFCRQVITWVDWNVRKRSFTEADALSARLEEELRLHIEKHGTVILPEVKKPD